MSDNTIYVMATKNSRPWYWPFRRRHYTIELFKPEVTDHAAEMASVREFFAGSGWDLYYSSEPFVVCPDCGGALDV
jgi:hypothetical protein